jgi:hypothetical protein
MIGACIADPFANGEGRGDIDTFTVPEGRRRRVYRPSTKMWHGRSRCQSGMIAAGELGIERSDGASVRAPRRGG